MEVVPYRVSVYAACTVATILLNYLLGKDMAWDTLHYHFYAGFSAVNDRFESDYFAAGPQSYFNPYAYLPFYLLVRLGLPALAVSSLLASVQSVVLWLTYELACSVCPSADRNERLLFGLCATILALMNPILLQEIGSSFADITTGGLVVGGWLLLVRSVGCPKPREVMFSALLLGIATALKPTNAVHAFAAFFVLAFVPLPLLARGRTLVGFGALLGAGFAVTSAPWSYRLAEMFGNPFFPLLNNIFRSPEFTTASLKHQRFIPDSLADALLRPFSMVGTDNMIHEELSSPDIRYALLLAVLAILVLQWIFRSRKPPEMGAPSPEPAAARRALVALGCGFVVDWIAWLSGSGNSRYFLPMACMAAVLAVALLFRLLKHHTRGRNWLMLTLLLAQGAQLSIGAQLRWSQAPWDGQWFNVDMPEKLATEPNLYLSIGMQPNSFIVPFLAGGSGVVNFFGGYALGPEGANAAHVKAMIKRSGTHVRVLVAGEGIYPDAGRREPRQSDVDDALGTFGLRVDMDDCETIRIRGLRREISRVLKSSIPVRPAAPEFRYDNYLTSCHVVADSRDRSHEQAARRKADVVLDRLEDECPKLFRPARPQTQYQNDVSFRVYPGTDLTAWVSKGEVRFTDPTRDVHEILVGREDQWLSSPPFLDCGRRHSKYFANILPSHE